MILHTASETISFIGELEEKAACFYEMIAEKYQHDEEMFRLYAKENRKFFKQLQQTYYSVITDAIEGCYAFELDADAYGFECELPEFEPYAELLITVREIEQKLLDLYADGAKQSEANMADIPRNMKMVVKKRSNRIEKLKELIV